MLGPIPARRAVSGAGRRSAQTCPLPRPSLDGAPHTPLEKSGGGTNKRVIVALSSPLLEQETAFLKVFFVCFLKFA